MIEIELSIPEAFECFLKPARFKVAYGGRAAAKSESFTRINIYDCFGYPHLVLCCREIQKSIKDSTKRTIEETMEEMGVIGQGKFFDSTQDRIWGRNGCEFIFKGLWRNANSIRSIKGVTRVLIDEGQDVSSQSLIDLIPTIRVEFSEIFIAFNPNFPTDAVYRMFVKDKNGRPAVWPPNSIVRKINYDQNPFLPNVLRREMEHDKANDYEKYQHVWGGELNTRSDEKVFAGKFVVREFILPESSDFLFGADWGFSQDPTTILRCVIDEDEKEIYIDYAAGKVGVELDDLPALFRKVPQSKRHRIRADSARPETISFMKKKHGYNIVGAEKGPGSIEDGIEFLKNYRIVVHPRCTGVIYELTNHSYKVNASSGDIKADFVDADNHYIDAARYAVEPVIRRRSKQLLLSIS